MRQFKVVRGRRLGRLYQEIHEHCQSRRTAEPALILFKNFQERVSMSGPDHCVCYIDLTASLSMLARGQKWPQLRTRTKSLLYGPFMGWVDSANCAFSTLELLPFLGQNHQRKLHDWTGCKTVQSPTAAEIIRY